MPHPPFRSLAAALVLLFAAAAADAQILDREARPRWFGGLEYYLADGIRNSDRGLRGSGARDLAASGFTTTSSLKTTAGIGLRGGVMVPIGNVGRFSDEDVPGLEVGGSLSYVRGPRSSLTFKGTDGGGQPGTFDYNAHFDAVRVLLEAQKSFLLHEGFKAAVGGGFGMARDMAGYTVTATGSMAQPPEERHRIRTGYTWELSAALALDMAGLTTSLGVRYAVFPAARFPNTTIGAVRWHPWGVFLNVAY